MALKSFALALVMLVFVGLDAGATNDSHSHAQLSFSPMQIRATAPGMPSSAAYVSIANHGDAADRLIAAKTVVFEKAGEITVTATVKRPADITPTMPGHNMSHQSQ